VRFLRFVEGWLEFFRRSSYYCLLVKGGLTLAQLGDFTRADDLFARAFEWIPNLGQVCAFYGSRLQLEGRNAEAAIAYRHFETS